MGFKKFYFLISLLFFSSIIFSQSVKISGSVQDEQSGEEIAGVEVRALGQSAYTNSEGAFELSLNFKGPEVTLVFSKFGFDAFEMKVEPENKKIIDLGQILLKSTSGVTADDQEDLIPVITLSENELEDEGDENISSLLSASRDVFSSTAAYVFSAGRFRIRGYDSENTLIYMNGVPVNDMESGRVYWSLWGGLNDVLRNRTSTIGLGQSSFTLGGIGGSSGFDTRASRQRKQVRFSYSLANRSYRNRAMLTYSTGMLSNGWAFSFSGSRRWAQEGYIPGTFYDAYAYFLSADKKLGKNHMLNFTAFGAPIQRGKSGAGTQEMYDLAGTNYYNPNWGYQNGEKRNARVAHTHQPMLILRHDWNLSSNTNITSAVSYQFGENGSTALDWYNANDPRPDYYRRLPSYIENEQSTAVADLLASNEDKRQLNWTAMYEANRNSYDEIENANGVEGNTVSGKRAHYMIEDRRYDTKRFNFNSNFETFLDDNLSLSGGLSYESQTIHYYKIAEDLLGAEFYVDRDKFAEFDSVSTSSFVQNNVDIPNRIVREGDEFGYDYENNIRKMGAWAQANASFSKVDAFLGFRGEQINFWRHGNVRNGKFPDDSGGDSEKSKFTDVTGKGGLSYKIDGRNYLLANALFQQRAPFMRASFVSTRTRNQLVRNLKQEKILSFEGGYRLNAPNLKARVIGYYTTFSDRLYNRSFYLDNAIIDADGSSSGGFVNYIMQGIDTKHMGVEVSAEVNLTSSFSVNGTAALGQYIYTSRPNVSVFIDNVAEELSSRTVYIKNFRIPGTPQNAYTIGLRYNSPKYWFATLNFNYFDNTWIDFYPERRTADAVSYVPDPQYSDQVIDPDSDLWTDIIDQEKAPSAFTLNFFGGKSFKVKDTYLYLHVGINNILDKKDFKTGGYEQFRFDFEGKNVNRFPTRYFYSYGRTYYINLSVRI